MVIFPLVHSTSHIKQDCLHARLQKVSLKRKVHLQEEIPIITKCFVPKRSRITEEVVSFCRRRDIKSINQITSNHMICSVNFQGGLKYCKADPVPNIYNDPAMVLLFNTNTTKRKKRQDHNHPRFK